jgi:dephospho-CoA kinase
MILIITGGIGSGKSVAAGMLNEMYGFPVYSADVRVKELYNECPGLLDSIEAELRCSLRDKDGSFVPSLLAREIFSDSGALEKVETLVFPVLMDDFNKWVEEHPAGVHIMESATVMEKDFFRGFGDLALLITAPLELRIKRAIQGDSSTEEQVRSRISKQKLMNDPALLEGVTWLPFEVIMNDGSTLELREKLTDFVEKNGLTKML